MGGFSEPSFPSVCAGAHAHEITPHNPPIFPREPEAVEMTNYNPPIDPPNSLPLGRITSQLQTDPRLEAAAGLFWSFDMVQERLVEAVHLWRRSPGGGRSPFATDGPWELVKRELFGPAVDKDAPLPRLPLRRSEVAIRDQTSDWLGWVQERDRRLVVLAVTKLAQGHGQVPWMDLRKPMGVALGADGLRMRYSRAIQAICHRLNGGNARSGTSTPEKSRR